MDIVRVYKPCPKPPYIGNKTPYYQHGLKRYRPKSTNSDTLRFSHLDIPTRHQYLTNITILTPTCRFFDTTITAVGYWYPCISPIHQPHTLRLDFFRSQRPRDFSNGNIHHFKGPVHTTVSITNPNLAHLSIPLTISSKAIRSP